MNGAVGHDIEFTDVKKLMNTDEKGCGCAEPGQLGYVRGGHSAGQGTNTDQVSVDQGQTATWLEVGAGGLGRDDGNAEERDLGLAVGGGGFDEDVCGVGVDGVTDSRGIGRDDGTARGRDPDRVDGGHDPGLAVGEGVLTEAVRGAGVDGVGGHDIGFIGEAGAGGRGSERGGVGGGGGGGMKIHVT